MILDGLAVHCKTNHHQTLWIVRMYSSFRGPSGVVVLGEAGIVSSQCGLSSAYQSNQLLKPVGRPTCLYPEALAA